MLFPIKITLFVILVLAAGFCFLVAYKRWTFALQFIFGKKSLRKKKKNKASAALQRVYLYAFGGFLLFLALMILF